MIQTLPKALQHESFSTESQISLLSARRIVFSLKKCVEVQIKLSALGIAHIHSRIARLCISTKPLCVVSFVFRSTSLFYKVEIEHSVCAST